MALTGRVIRFTVPGVPVPAPRIVESDKWRPRTCVQRYWAFRDLVRLAAVGNPHTKLSLDVLGIYIRAWLPIPKSYSNKKRQSLHGMPHRFKPDTDNLTKAVKDALFENDEMVFVDRCVKRYVREGEAPRIEVRLLLA